MGSFSCSKVELRGGFFFRPLTCILFLGSSETGFGGGGTALTSLSLLIDSSSAVLARQFSQKYEPLGTSSLDNGGFAQSR